MKLVKNVSELDFVSQVCLHLNFSLNCQLCMSCHLTFTGNGSLKTSIPRISLPKCETLFTFIGTKEASVSPAISTARKPPNPPLSLPQPPPPPVVVPISNNVMQPATVRCKLCNCAFGSQTGLSKHIRRCHPESDVNSASEVIVTVRHKCHLCNVMCSSSDGLRKHMTKRHHIQTSVIFHTCNGCGLKLPSKPDWIKHTRLYCDHRRTNTTSQGRIAIKLEKPPPAPVQSPPPPLPPPPAPVQVIPLTLPPPPPVSIESTSIIPVTSVDLSKLMNPIPHFRTGNNELLCSLCPVRSSNDIFRREDQLKRHLFLKHVDYFFSPVKLPEVSKEQFEAYCQEIIENDMKPTAQQNSSFPGGRVPLTYTCVHCSTFFYERRAMNAHLIQSHYALLLQKLMDLQRKSTKQIDTPPAPTPQLQPPPPPVLQPPPPPIYSPLKTPWVPKRKLKCSSCSAVFSQSSSLSYHKTFNCPGIFATSNGHGVSSQLTGRGNVGRFRCVDCDTWFLQKPSLYRHRKKWHSKNATSPLPPPPPSKNLPKAVPQDSSDFPYVCDYCENRFTTFRSKKSHMQNICYKRRNHDNNRSSGSPQAWQNDGDGEEGEQPLVPMVTSTFSLSTSSTPTPQNLCSNSWSCQNCGSSFICPSALFKHQQEYCHTTVGAASSQELNEGISVGIENYYDENFNSTPTDGQEMVVEQEEEEVYPGSFVSTKIEVLDFEQVQIHPSNHENSESEILEIEEMNNLYQGSMMVNTDGDEEIIFEREGSSVDPLC